MLVRRDNRQKTPAKQQDTVFTVTNILNEIQKELYKKAKEQLDKSITQVKDYDEFKKTLEAKGGFLKASWCGNSDCELKIKEETGATIRLIPFEKEKPVDKCVCCGQAGKEIVYFARSY
jgi:prolyl-tRNA synthetase